jgi:hypothetical protein
MIPRMTSKPEDHLRALCVSRRAALAGFLLARNASRVGPMAALRHE